MKYTYAYKSSDGVRHEASIDADSREAVFEALRSRGIRAIKVVASDGSKANGETNGVRRRIALLGAAASSVVVGVAVLVVALTITNSPETDLLVEETFDSPTRRQLIGDAVVIEKGIRTGWEDVFALEGDRFLASFAVPGALPAIRSTTAYKLESALASDVRSVDAPSIEARQIVAIVSGMKDELRAYLSAGGTMIGYGRRLVERQDAEIMMYRRAKNELDHARSTMDPEAYAKCWEERNEGLRKLGIKIVPFAP